MNEQIKKLADQAGLGIQHNGIVLTKDVNAAEALDQFAELIVQECARELDERTVFVRGVRAGTWIKQHFEIKE